MPCGGPYWPGGNSESDMAILALIIIGAAAGFIATRLMNLQTDLVTTIAIGVLGALVGGLVLRFLLAITGLAAGFVGAILGAMALIWLCEAYGPKRSCRRRVSGAAGASGRPAAASRSNGCRRGARR